MDCGRGMLSGRIIAAYEAPRTLRRSSRAFPATGEVVLLLIATGDLIGNKSVLISSQTATNEAAGGWRPLL